MSKELSNPFSTGGGGPRFENQVQTLFVVLMLTGGTVPSLPPFPIKRIKLQGRYEGYRTDDFIAFVEEVNVEQKAKLLAQIRHSVTITENDSKFGEVIKAAWSDFTDPLVFESSSDVFALITGPLTAADDEARIILEWSRTSETAEEFLKKVNLGKFSSETKRNKVGAFRAQLMKANNSVDVGVGRLWEFLKRFYLLPCDLDVSSGFVFSFLRSSIEQFTTTDAVGVFELVAREVALFNQNAGTLTQQTVSPEILRIFSQRRAQIPSEYIPLPEVQSPAEGMDYSKGPYADSVMFASLLGSWNEKSEGDREVIRKLIEGND